MPTQRSPRTTTKTTPTTPNGGRKPNGGTTRPATSRRPATGNGGNGKPSGAWPVELVLAAEVELSIESENGDAFGFAVCSICASLIPSSEVSRALHGRWHDLINGIDQRAG